MMMAPEHHALIEAQNKLLIAYYRAQLDVVRGFSLGAHSRLGGASPVLLLSDGPLHIIVNMVFDRPGKFETHVNFDRNICEICQKKCKCHHLTHI